MARTRISHGLRPRRVMLALVWHEIGHMQGICRYATEARWLLSRQASGVPGFVPDGIISQLYRTSPELVAYVQRADVPTVGLGPFEQSLGLPCVVADIGASGRLAGEHLLERGFHRIGFLGQEAYHAKFFEALCATLAPAGIVASPIWADDPELLCQTGMDQRHSEIIHDEFTLRRQDYLRHRLRTFETPMGWFVPDIIWAFDMVEACLAEGIQVPEQVAVVSTGELPTDGEHAAVPLTMILHDFEQQAYRAAQMLDRMMQGEKLPVTAEMIPPKAIIARESTRVRVFDDPHMARAVALIMRRLHDPNLVIKAVIHAGGVKRSTLYKKFIASTGMAPAKYVEHLRFEEAKKLLETTELAVATIAERCGFVDVRQFCRAMKRVTGTTATEWRARHRAEQPAR